MSPRKASLRVAHLRGCANASKTALDSVGRGNGCTCNPSYYVFHRNRDGRPVKGARVKDRRVAESALRLLQGEIDSGRAGLAREKKITFNEWADEFTTIVEARVSTGELHPRTLRAYAGTLE